MKSKSIIIYGGTFDPIHKGHIKIAQLALKQFNASKLIFVPCKKHPHNKKISASDNQRLEMLELAIKKYENFEISRHEINKDDVSYTIDTINFYKTIYIGYKIYLLIGYDQLLNFKNWHKYNEILDNVKIICFKRKQNNIEKKKNKYELVEHKMVKSLLYLNISSSQIRTNPKRFYLNKDVLNYINENGIYAYDRLKKIMSEYRLNHSIRVANLASEIASSLGMSSLIKKAYVSGIYHDYAKEFDKKIQTSLWTKIKLNYFKYPSWKVVHAPLGAYEIKKRFFINDKDVLIAIKNHTILKEKTTLAKIIYCADKLDIRHDGAIKNRDIILDVCKKDIDKGLEMITNELLKMGFN